MKTTLITILCLSLAACVTQQQAVEITAPPQLRAVITDYDANGARIQCVLDTSEPVDHVWQSILVTDTESGKVFAHSVLQQMVNILSDNKTEIEDQHLLTGTERHSLQGTKAYISTALLYVANLDKGDHIRLTLSIGNEQIQRDIR